jgi:hypothetical protein
MMEVETSLQNFGLQYHCHKTSLHLVTVRALKLTQPEYCFIYYNQ